MKTIASTNLTLVELNLLYSSIQHIITTTKKLIDSLPSRSDYPNNLRDNFLRSLWALTSDDQTITRLMSSIENLNSSQFRGICLNFDSEFSHFFNACSHDLHKITHELMQAFYQFNFIRQKLASYGLKITILSLKTYVHAIYR